MKSVVCLISGRGSNLQALLQAALAGNWQADPGARISLVVSNRPGAGGLQVARQAGVPAIVIDHAAFANREAFESELADRIDGQAPALVVLAGFMRVLTPAFVARYPGRLLNIHPSLLPAFAGLDTHRRALQAGVRLHGATVHFVTEQLDGGPIVAQAAVPVLPGDTEGSLAGRVLRQEHALLPRCVRWILEGRVRLDGGRVVAEGVDASQLLTMER
jgi:phosphoribosylglycinamide formyltransferase 1